MGMFACVNALLDAHTETEIKNNYGNTAAILASACNHEAALRRILEAGADTEAVNVSRTCSTFVPYYCRASLYDYCLSK